MKKAAKNGTRFIGVLLLSLRRCLVLRNFCALGRLLPLQGLPRHSSLTFQALYIICNPSTKANDMILNHSQVQGFADDTDMTRGRSSVDSFTETVESFSFAATRSATIF